MSSRHPAPKSSVKMVKSLHRIERLPQLPRLVVEVHRTDGSDEVMLDPGEGVEPGWLSGIPSR